MWKEIPAWAAVDSKHKSGTVLWDTTDVSVGMGSGKK